MVARNTTVAYQCLDCLASASRWSGINHAILCPSARWAAGTDDAAEFEFLPGVRVSDAVVRKGVERMLAHLAGRGERVRATTGGDR